MSQLGKSILLGQTGQPGAFNKIRYCHRGVGGEGSRTSFTVHVNGEEGKGRGGRFLSNFHKQKIELKIL